MPRAHLVKGVIRKVSGAPATGTCQVLDAGTGSPLSATLYAGDTGATSLPNPFTFADGLVDFYLDNPDRVHLLITPDGGDPQQFNNLDVPLPADASHSHGQYAEIGGATFTGRLTSSDILELERTSEVVNVPTVGATTTLDCNAGMVHRVTLTQNTTLALSGLDAVAGRASGVTVILKQDATGNRTVAWPAGVKWGDGVAPTLAAGANAVNIVTFLVDEGVVYGFLGGRDMK